MTESMADKWHGEVMKTQRTYALLDYGEGVLRFGGGHTVQEGKWLFVCGMPTCARHNALCFIHITLACQLN